MSGVECDPAGHVCSDPPVSGLHPGVLDVGEERRVAVRIVGDRLPGRSCPPWEKVEVSVQIGKDHVEPTPADGERFEAEAELRAVGAEDGLRWRGKAAHGGSRDRFLYLVWTGVRGDERERFRRAKLKLNGIPGGVLQAGLEAGHLKVRLGLTDDFGMPVCATVAESEWTVG